MRYATRVENVGHSRVGQKTGNGWSARGNQRSETGPDIRRNRTFKIKKETLEKNTNQEGK